MPLQNFIPDNPPNQDVNLRRHVRIPYSFSIYGRNNLIINPSSSISQSKQTIFPNIPPSKVILIIKYNILKAL